eukprot:3869900-Prymnesium_polylepis.2
MARGDIQGIIVDLWLSFWRSWSAGLPRYLECALGVRYGDVAESRLAPQKRRERASTPSLTRSVLSGPPCRRRSRRSRCKSGPARAMRRRWSSTPFSLRRSRRAHCARSGSQHSTQLCTSRWNVLTFN